MGEGEKLVIAIAIGYGVTRGKARKSKAYDQVSFSDKGGIHSKTDLGIVKYHFEVGAEYAKEKSKGSVAG